MQKSPSVGPRARRPPQASAVVAALALPSAAVLTARLARCIGIWETNRGGDNPEPKESALDTVAGVHASMATIERATMPCAVDAFGRFAALRNRAAPPLSTTEVAAADARCKAVKTLLGKVTTAANAG